MSNTNLNNLSAGSIVTMFFGFIFLAILAGFLLAFPIMWLWNWLMPVIFGLPIIGFWKAWGLMMLCSLLFKSHTNGNTTNK